MPFTSFSPFNTSIYWSIKYYTFDSPDWVHLGRINPSGPLTHIEVTTVYNDALALR